MKIETKYDIGQELFYVDSRGCRNEFIRVCQARITNINLGGKAWEKYSIGNTTRGDGDLYTNLTEAKEEAMKQALKHYEHNLELINKQHIGMSNKLVG
jgi:predicted Zn-dependent protease